MARPRLDGSPSTAPNKQRLSHLAVTNLQKGDRPYTVWDTVQRGLAVTVQPSGSKAWKCIYAFRGRPRWHHLAYVNAVGLAKARKLAIEIMYQVAQGKEGAALAAHSLLTKWRTTPLSEADKDKILQSLFVSRAEYEQYVIDLREREEREQKEAEAREAARQARLENDPKYWKRMYERMVERDEERNRDMWFGVVMVLAAFLAIAFLLRIFGFD